MLVSEIHKNIDLVLGIKNIFELEGIINSQDCCFSYLNKSIPFFAKECIILKPKEQKLIKVEAVFIDEVSGLAIIKVLDKNVQNTMILKLKCTWNSATLDVMNSSLETVTFHPKEMLGILDLRSMGYYKIKQGILQQNLSKYYQFQSADNVCEQFNRFINMLKKERKEETKEKYPWLDPSDDRKYMSDREILEKYVDLGKSCLTDKEKNQVMDMLYKYKEAFSLSYEIGPCPNIEVEIDMIDDSPFFIQPYHAKEQDNNFIDKEMKWLCCLGVLKEGFSAYSSPVMLISRNVTKDKRVVTDIRHLNVRITKHDLVYPLIKDTFSVLGSSRCEVVSVLNLKDAFYSLRLSENSKRYCGILPYFGSTSYLYQRMPMGLMLCRAVLAYLCYITWVVQGIGIIYIIIYLLHCNTQLLIFGFSSLHTLRQYIRRIMWLIDTIINLY